MHRWIRDNLAIAGCLLLLILASQCTIAQDPPAQAPAPLLGQPLPPETTPSAIPSDDPIMQALRERAVIAPEKSLFPSQPHSKPSRRNDRWRIAERMLRHARIMERDADTLEQLGDVAIAESLRQLATATRHQVVRLLQASEIPVESKNTP